MTREEIARLSGPDLATLLASKLMGWKQSEQQPHVFHDADGTPVVVGRPDYTLRCRHRHFDPHENVADAWLMVDKLADQGITTLVKADGLMAGDHPLRYDVYVRNQLDQPHVSAETATRGLCLAIGYLFAT